ncbi:VOC family protein [Crenobacter cavernae]|uniref:VOC family protein n=1 Tax=Crenobacter cavernae TaxID=2290923 RepID=A0ABY0FJ05_9NEIS|nr:VOC family protein [Crenobacter cavernae]RXZ45557.1 VOC family protein [Crenobacter cavernae]
MAVKPVPDGYHTVTPYLAILNAAAAIDFYKQAFGAVEAMRVDAPGGKVGHAELRIGDSAVMLADECPDMGFRSPQTLGGPGMTLMLYVDDVDAWFARALAAGAKTLRPLQDQFYGDRSGTLEDPFGHVWTLATHIEDLSLEEITERAAKFMPQG